MACAPVCDCYTCRMGTSNPIPIRFNADDTAILNALRAKTGLTIPGVVRLALRALRDSYGPALAATARKRKVSK